MPGNTAEAIDFLQHWEPSGPWVLVAIDPASRRIDVAAYGPDTVAAARGWIDFRQNKQNLYFHVNRVRKGLREKARKGDVTVGLALHVDIDARAGEDLENERARILKVLLDYRPAPSVVVACGGGAQGFWLLKEGAAAGGVGDWNEIEARNRGLERALGGDHCHNIDRIMRLPGTVNVPDAKKAAKGRVRALAHIVEAEWDRRYSLSDFAPVYEEEARTNGVDRGGWVTLEEDGLPEDVAEGTRALIKTGDVTKFDGDRSKAVWAVCCELARAGVSADDIASIIADPANGISGHVRDQKNPVAYASRQASKAYKEASADFSLNADGKIVANSQRNIRLALSRMGVRLTYNSFLRRELVEGLSDGRVLLDDAAFERVYLIIDARFRFRPSVEFCWMVMRNESRRHAFHPVLNYLGGLVWDKVPRINTWLIRYGGAEDSEYTRAVGRLMLVAAVRRVRRPGCKFDEMLVLESGQGTDKSTALKALSVEEEWFTDDVPLNLDSKETIEALSGRWIVEAAELTGMRKGDVEHLKAFLSRQVDRARLAFGRAVTEAARQCVIFGTTNSTQYLRDSTGNRRFWPVRVIKFDVAALIRDRDMLWAEAAAAEEGGESIRLAPELYPAAGDAQDDRQVVDPWIDTIKGRMDEFLVGDDGGEYGGKILGEHVWVILDMPADRRTQEHNFRLGESMRALSWRREKRRWGGKLRWCYVRGTDFEIQKNEIEVSRDPQTRALFIGIRGKKAQSAYDEDTPF